MEFEIIIDGQIERFTQFSDMASRLAHWNNFTPELDVRIRKVPSETSTLGINTGDEIDTRDLFGRA